MYMETGMTTQKLITQMIKQKYALSAQNTANSGNRRVNICMVMAAQNVLVIP